MIARGMQLRSVADRLRTCCVGLVAGLVATACACSVPAQEVAQLSNAVYELMVSCGPDSVDARLHDKRLRVAVADGRYLYRATRQQDDGTQLELHLDHPSVSVAGNTLTLRGDLDGLRLEHSFVLFSDKPIVFNQENMLFSVVSVHQRPEGTFLRFGGTCMISGEPAALTRVAPGQAVDLGVVRYQSMAGDYREAPGAFVRCSMRRAVVFPTITIRLCIGSSSTIWIRPGPIDRIVTRWRS